MDRSGSVPVGGHGGGIMIHGHGGNVAALAQRIGCRTSDIIDMSSNVNPLGPPPALMDHLSEALGKVRRLPEVPAM